MMKTFDRRSFLSLGAQAACVAGGSLISNPAMSMVLPERKPARDMMERRSAGVGERRITFKNLHTGEAFSGVYRVGDKYLPDAFDRINLVMRDFRANEVFPIDPRVLDIMYTVHQMTGSSEPFGVLSGYRSPKTNAMLRKASTGVAKNSLHMTGQAVDVRLAGFSTTRLRDLAIGLKAGGVGYYRKSDFVHMDSGGVRTW